MMQGQLLLAIAAALALFGSYQIAFQYHLRPSKDGGGGGPHAWCPGIHGRPVARRHRHPPPRGAAAGAGGPGLRYRPAAGGDMKCDQHWEAAVASMDLDPCNIVLLAFADKHFHDFLRSFAANLRRAGIDNVLIGAGDEATLRECERLGLSAIELDTSVEAGFETGAGVMRWRAGGSHILDCLLEGGYDVLLTDMDVMWMMDPQPFFRSHEPWVLGADVMVSTDCLSVEVDSAEPYRIAQLEKAGYGPLTRCGNRPGSNGELSANIGIAFFKGRPAARDFAREWHRRLVEASEPTWDQQAFNWVIESCSPVIPLRDNMTNQECIYPIRAVEAPGVPSNRLLWGWGQRIRLGVLPADLFANSHVFSLQQSPQRRGVLPYALHATFQNSGTEGKRHRFREAGLWEDPLSQWDGAGARYLVVSNEVPAALVKAHPAGPHDVEAHVEAHLRLVAYQLDLLRHAVVAAAALGRILVLPRLICGCDRYWGNVMPDPGGCNIFVSDLRSIPFVCPADTILNVDRWRARGEQEGLQAAFRGLLAAAPSATRGWKAALPLDAALQEGELKGGGAAMHKQFRAANFLDDPGEDGWLRVEVETREAAGPGGAGQLRERSSGQWAAEAAAEDGRDWVYGAVPGGTTTPGSARPRPLRAGGFWEAAKMPRGGTLAHLPPPAATVTVPPCQDAGALRRALAAHLGARVVHLVNPIAALSGLGMEAGSAETAFKNEEVDLLSSRWCCHNKPDPDNPGALLFQQPERVMPPAGGYGGAGTSWEHCPAPA